MKRVISYGFGLMIAVGIIVWLIDKVCTYQMVKEFGRPETHENMKLK